MAEAPLVHVVDDDEALRDSLGLALRTAGYSCSVHESGVAFLAAPFDPDVGVALVDVRMPGLDGIELLRALAARGVRLPVIIMTGHADVPLAVAAMKAGAVDLVEKPCDFGALRAAIARALDRSLDRPPAPWTKVAGAPAFAGLTARERDVLARIVAGDQNKEAARALGISPRTVEIHRANIMRKTGARGLADLVRAAVRAEAPRT